jgi:hypothetical protein
MLSSPIASKKLANDMQYFREQQKYHYFRRPFTGCFVIFGFSTPDGTTFPNLIRDCATNQEN